MRRTKSSLSAQTKAPLLSRPAKPHIWCVNALKVAAWTPLELIADTPSAVITCGNNPHMERGTNAPIDRRRGECDTSIRVETQAGNIVVSGKRSTDAEGAALNAS